jgi:hypothetical protein
MPAAVPKQTAGGESAESSTAAGFLPEHARHASFPSLQVAYARLVEAQVALHTARETGHWGVFATEINEQAEDFLRRAAREIESLQIRAGQTQKGGAL